MEYVEEAEVREISPEKERNNRIINAIAAYLISFVLITVFFYLITGFLAYKFYLHPKIYFFKIEFLSNFNEWTEERVIKTFSPAPIFYFLLGVALILLQRVYKKRPGIFKMVLLWFGIHALNTFIVHILLSPMELSTDLNFTMITSYLYWQDTSKLTMSVTSLTLIFLLGNIVAKPFVQLANTTQLIHKNESRFYFLFQVVFIPYLAGTLLSFFYFSGASSIIITTYAVTMFAVVFSIFIYAMKSKMIMVYRLPESVDINKKLLVGLILLLIFIKLSPLNTGIVLHHIK